MTLSDINFDHLIKMVTARHLCYKRCIFLVVLNICGIILWSYMSLLSPNMF